MKAPGTFHHSQMVGILAESGAAAIGTNALFARVASYYHDVGKMKKPNFFIENQPGENPHDNLSPNISARIIAAHVTDGIELAQFYKVPDRIQAVIPEHQGTKLIGFFYHKAKQLGLKGIKEEDYRYPGPKPQGKESAIIMLADATEAAARAQKEKSPEKIREIIHKIATHHLSDGQFDDCGLTLGELSLIEDAFFNTLSGVYHHRTEYPQQGPSDHDRSSQQQSSTGSNITPLFKSKNA